MKQATAGIMKQATAGIMKQASAGIMKQASAGIMKQATAGIMKQASAGLAMLVACRARSACLRLPAPVSCLPRPQHACAYLRP